MKRSGIDTNIIVGNSRAQEGVQTRSLRRLCGYVIGLTCVITVGVAEPCLGQQNMRLAIRPRDMATGTRTDRAGRYMLDTPNKDAVYVPQQCIGTQRCPLIVFLWPMTGVNAESIWQWLGPVADKYGMIILGPGVWSSQMDSTRNGSDVAMKHVLTTFAIDPDKIAMIGRCATGNVALGFGNMNMDVFSRIGSFTADAGDPPVRSPEQTTEYYLSTAITENAGYDGAQQLQRKGYRVKHVTNFRKHEHQVEDYDFMGRWLQESWSTPDLSARSVPYVFTRPAPLLTIDAIGKLTAFWTRFMQEPESIQTAARRAYVREVVVPVGANEQTSLLMVEMPALAAKYPSVAKALQDAELTAQEHDAYRAALVSARITENVSENFSTSLIGPVEKMSVLGQNVEFMAAHPDELQALAATKMWDTP